MDLANILQTVIPLAKAAGEILKASFSKPIHQDLKGATDPVTEVDRASEAFLIENLRQSFPHIGIVGEEGGGYLQDSAEYLWYVDPIDGTVNYAHGMPIFCVMLALATRDYEPLLGVVYDPLRDECFYGYQGGGAFLNGRRLQVSQQDQLIGSLLGTGFPYDTYISPENNLNEYCAMAVKVQGIRRIGTAGLDLCYVASGRFDGYWEQKLKPWDALAGILMVREAGGFVTDYQGGRQELRVHNMKVIASNGRIHQAMQETILGAREKAGL
jgi:myo-inositol-1(or 4)-monophosphatase